MLELLRRPDVNYAGLMSLESGKFATPELADIQDQTAQTVIEQIEIVAKYAGYIDRQHAEVEKALHFEQFKLPPDMDYAQVTALSIEARQTLAKHKPQTLGLASRISGVTPVTVSLLLVYLKKNGYKGFTGKESVALVAEEAAP
jgi:tRNA uridine 5-carboxymethylaminomethyl modification enzyme